VTPRPVVIVGFVGVAMASLGGGFQEDGSLIFVEEPDVIRKRDVAAKLAGAPLVRELIPVTYQLPGAADAFYNAHPGLDPVAVVPLVEYATPFAARLAERYGLPGAGFGAATLLRDKELLRAVTRAAGIVNPASEPVAGPDEVRAFLAAHPGKVVLKPANRQASVGTTVLTGPEQVDAAWAACTRQDEGVFVPDRPMPLRMLCEEHVSGPEYSVELLTRDGVTLFRNVTGKVLFAGANPVEQSHTVPAVIPDELAATLVERTERVLAAVGFGTGTVHCEWIVADGEPHLVECAGRFAGDGIVDLIERAYRFPLVQTYYRLLKGEDLPPLPQAAARGAVVRFLAGPGEEGELDGVTGLDEARAVPGVVAVDVTVAPGDPVPVLRSSWDRLGDVVTEAGTPADAEHAAAAAVAALHLKVRPALRS
jgi:biotin carboxylase